MTRNTAENHRKGAIRGGLHVMPPHKAGYILESIHCKERQAISILKREMDKNNSPKMITWHPTLDKLEDSNQNE